MRIYIIISGYILIITGIVKIASSLGHAGILTFQDPIFSISFRIVFQLVGFIEIGVGIFCMFFRMSVSQIFLLAWLSTMFVIYRIGLVVLDYHRPCICLGNLTDALHISSQLADNIIKVILAYLLLGSYATLFWIWRQKRKAGATTLPSAPSAPTSAP